MSNPSTLPSDIDRLDFRAWFERAWWEAYHAGGKDAKAFRGSRYYLDKALPEFEALLASQVAAARIELLERLHFECAKGA